MAGDKQWGGSDGGVTAAHLVSYSVLQSSCHWKQWQENSSPKSRMPGKYPGHIPNLSFGATLSLQAQDPDRDSGVTAWEG